MSTEHAARSMPYLARFINPIIIKEMRGQMRGPRAFVVLTLYLAGLGILTYGLYRLTLTSFAQYAGVTPQSAYLGQILFSSLALLILLCICFITPSLTAGAISGENERRTYDMLLSTPLRPISILWGKMVASLMWIFMLILAAVPLSSIIFVFGGIALRDIIQVIGLLGLVAITYGSVGMFFSALTRRTGQATVFTYLLVMLCVFGGMFVWVAANILGIAQTFPRQILSFSPVNALASAIITPEMSVYGAPWPISLMMFLGGGDWLYSAEVLSRPLWQYTTAVYLALTAVLWLVTVQLVKPVRRWRLGWRGWLVWLLVLLLVAGGLAITFGTAWGSTGFKPSTAPVPVPTAAPVAFEAASHIDTAPLPPTPTPPPPPPLPPSAAEVEDMLEGFVVQNVMQNLMPPDYHLLSNVGAFCDLEMLELTEILTDRSHIQTALWAYCRVYSVEDGELRAGAGVSMPLVVSLIWQPDGTWGVESYYLHAANLLSPMVRQRLVKDPYDEAAGEARLREQAQERLLGE
ncbi:MAG: ABC transporter permease [Anaerolineae bacterium]|nr:ABC transporter permease [Anaerolineae bacterium]